MEMHFDSSRLRAVLFDMDGTLADTIPDILETFNGILVRHERPPLNRAGLVSLFGPTEEGILQNLFPHWSREQTSAELEREMNRAESIPLFDGIPALIEDCSRAGLGVGVFTGAGRRYGLARMKRMGILPQIQGFVAGDDVPRSKPAPDGVLRLCELLQVAPRDAVYIGDSPLDLQSARDAGVWSVGVAWGVNPRAVLLSEKPVAVVETLPELTALLGLGKPSPVEP